MEEVEKSPSEIQREIDDYNPFLARRDPNYVPPVGLTLWSEDQDVEDEYVSPSEIDFVPCVISFVVSGLNPNTLYEFRTSCKNSVGMSEFSIPSLRCKTKRDAAPGASRAPNLLEVKSSYVIVSLDVPPAGGGPIESFFVDIKTLEGEDASIDTREFKYIDGKRKFRISGLKPGSSVQFRSRASNKIGEGPSTVWTGKLNLPALA